jgi:peptide/nickel transport system permease protein
VGATLAKRLALAVPTLVGVAALVFLMGRALPADPVEVMLGESAPRAEREALRREMGLDRPLHHQLGAYFAGLLRLDLGRSLKTGRPVAQELAAAFPRTLQLGLSALLGALALALPLGTAAARYPGGRWDRLAGALSTAGLSVPSFFLGPVLLLLFAVERPWFPVSGADEPGALVLPAATLGVPLAAYLTRVVRASLREEVGRDYLRTARARGLSEGGAFVRHALPCALPPVVTVAGLQLGAVLTGAVLAETIFRWPGMGTLLLGAVGSRDYPLLQGCVLCFAVVYVLANLAADLAVAALDPRVREGGR